MKLAPSFVESQGMEREAVEMFHRRATARFQDAHHKLQIAQAVFDEAKVHKEMADARLQQTGGSLEETEAPAEEKEDKEETAEDQGEEEPEEDGAMEEPEEEPSDERSDDRSEEREFIEGGEYIDLGLLKRCEHKRCNRVVHPSPKPSEHRHEWVDRYCCGKCYMSSQKKDPAHGPHCIGHEFPQPEGTWICKPCYE